MTLVWNRWLSGYLICHFQINCIFDVLIMFSLLFFICIFMYHEQGFSIRYPFSDWKRVYFYVTQLVFYEALHPTNQNVCNI